MKKIISIAATLEKSEQNWARFLSTVSSSDLSLVSKSQRFKTGTEPLLDLPLSAWCYHNVMAWDLVKAWH